MKNFGEFCADQERAHTSWEQWELRQQGARPIVPEPEQPPVSCLTPKYAKSSVLDAPEQEQTYRHDSVLMRIVSNHSIFRLPGQGEQTNAKCGQWVHPLSCPDYGDHQHSLEGRIEHDRFVAQHSCHRPDCPICHESWGARQATNTADRLMQAVGLYRAAGYGIQWIDKFGRVLTRKIGRIDHVMLSPPQLEWVMASVSTLAGARALHNEARRIIRKAGMVGGVLVFHCFRQNDPRESNFREDMEPWVWYVSPHFHVIGCGFLQQSDIFYAETNGWTYKKMERRETIYGTVKYVLSHCGIADGMQAVTYFGLFSNNKIVVEKIEKVMQPIKCKACGKEMHLYSLWEGDEKTEVDWTDDRGVYYQPLVKKTYKLRDKPRPAPTHTRNDTLVIQLTESGFGLYRGASGEYHER